MFCGKCGSNIPEGAAVCPACGNPTGVAPVQGGSPKKGFDLGSVNKGLIAAIIGVVVIIALVIVLLSSCGGSPEKTVENYIDASFNGTGEDVYDASNIEAFFDLLVKEGEWDKDDLEDVRENIIDSFDERNDDNRDDFEDEYGEDWSIDVEITKTKELKNSDLKDYEEILEEYYDIEVDIEEGYTVKVKITIEGEDGDDKERGEFTVLKINGKWVLTNALYWGYYYAD